MYWMEAVVRDEVSPVKEVKQRRAGYVRDLRGPAALMRPPA